MIPACIRPPFYKPPERLRPTASNDLKLMRMYAGDRLDVKDSALVKLGFFDQFRNFFSCSRRRERLKRLDVYVTQVCAELPSSLDTPQAIEFYRRLSKWTEMKVNLGCLSDGVRGVLSPKLKRVSEAYRAATSPRCADILASDDFSQQPSIALEEQVGKPHQRRLKWEAVVAETKLAAALGIGPIEAGSGANGAKFGLGLDGRKLTVIKEKGVDDRLITERLKFQRTQPDVLQNDPRQAGAIAYMFDEYFGFGLIPPTYTDEMGYSIQLIVGGESADKAKIADGPTRMVKLKDKVGFDATELELLQKKAILNFVLCDLDGKDDKLRIEVDENGKIIHIHETDNDNTSPQNPLESGWKDKSTREKNHAWKNHNWARCQFVRYPESELDRILNALSVPKVSKFMLESQNTYPNFWTRDRADEMLMRIAFLQAAAAEPDFTPFKLAAFYSSKAPAYDDVATRNRVEQFMGLGSSTAPGGVKINRLYYSVDEATIARQHSEFDQLLDDDHPYHAGVADVVHNGEAERRGLVSVAHPNYGATTAVSTHNTDNGRERFSDEDEKTGLSADPVY